MVCIFRNVRYFIVERLRRRMKYKDVYLKAHETIIEAHRNWYLS